MKMVLSYTFITIFVLLVALTVMVVFFGFGTPAPEERDFLFKLFIAEIGIAVLALL
jgi:hypothetical protein